jgi:hypothetical protein
VTVTVTFRYRTSRGDAGSFSAFLDDETPFPDTLSLPMRPSMYRRSGAPSGKTVTLTWIRRDVAASGKQYTVVTLPSAARPEWRRARRHPDCRCGRGRHRELDTGRLETQNGHMPTGLHNGQRSTKKLLASVVRRIFYALRWSR